MPGASLRVAVEGREPDHWPDAEGALAALRHLPGYDSAVTYESGPTALGRSGYPEYPARRVREDGVVGLVEGRVYRTASGAPSADTVAASLVSEDSDRGTVRQWVRRTDGEFVLWAVDPETGAVAVLNDALARLPLYYREDEAGLVVSRESEFALAHAPSVRFDRLAMAQHLLFGYPLGDRTLWEGVRRVPPGTLLRATPSGGVEFENLHTWNYEEIAHAHRSVEDNAARLATLFRAASDARCAAGGRPVVSLSGGHDSRAVAAAAREGPAEPVAATFSRAEDGESADARVARSVADALGIRWEHHELSTLSPERVYRLLRLKNGLNPVGMSFLLEFLEGVRDRHGRDATYLTGDGGDKALPDLTPGRSVADVDDLVSYLLAVHAAVDADEAAAAVGLTRAEVVDSVRAVVEDYPEIDPARRAVHFLVHERGINWLNEGEDRNRAYCWSTSPFYSTPFFAYAMGVPPDQKASHRLYRAFFEELWPDALSFDDANYGAPMDSARYRLVLRGLDVLERHPRLREAVGSVYRGEVGYEPPETLRSTVSRQVRRCPAVRDYLSEDALAPLLEDGEVGGSKEAFRLFTLTSAVDRLACGNDRPRAGERSLRGR